MSDHVWTSAGEDADDQCMECGLIVEVADQSPIVRIGDPRSYLPCIPITGGTHVMRLTGNDVNDHPMVACAYCALEATADSPMHEYTPHCIQE